MTRFYIKLPLRLSRRGSLRLSKNYASPQVNRAAGEREGVRPASHYNNPPQKRLIYQAFRSAAAF